MQSIVLKSYKDALLHADTPFEALSHEHKKAFSSIFKNFVGQSDVSMT